MNISNTFTILKDKLRPIVMLSCGAYAIIDSGAQVPVWLRSPQDLQTEFPGVTEDRSVLTRISGFGGKGSYSYAAVLPVLKFEGVDLTIKNVPIALQESMIGINKFDMVLPLNIFKLGTLSIGLNKRSRVDSVTYMNLSNTDEYCCIKLVRPSADPNTHGLNLLDGVYCLTQQEVLAQGISPEKLEEVL